MDNPSDAPVEVFPEPTIDEVADAIRPQGLGVDQWRDEALEAVAQLSEPQREIRPSLGLALVSMLLFYIALGYNFGWELTPFIVLIILIHEMGHYVAMKAFGYRELQLFFIPFFGAAVSGKKIDATQTQRAVVALAGPAPGMLIASAFVVTALKLREANIDIPVFSSDTAYKVMFWMLIINGFNLIPLEPLDGGHLFNALFFSRHPWMESACRAISAVIFLYCARQVNWIFGVIAVLILLFLGITHKIALLSSRLREADLNVDPSLDSMPLERLLKAYVLSRDVINETPGAKLEFNVQRRTGLLQRAYPGALARPASGGAVAALLLCYLLIIASGLGAWWEHLHPTPQQQSQQADDGHDEEQPQVKIFH